MTLNIEYLTKLCAWVQNRFILVKLLSPDSEACQGSTLTARVGVAT